MDRLQQYLVPYLLSQVLAIAFVMIAYRNTRITRSFFAVIFLGAAGTNLSIALRNPDVYLDYAAMALPFYRDFIRGWFSHYNHVLVPLIAAGQFLIGAGMLLKGWWVRWACYGAILFLLGITPLMVGSAFPFTLLVALAAGKILQKDKKDFLWRTPAKEKAVPSSPLSTAVFLSWIVLMLTVVATATGLFVTNLYRDNAFVQTAWRANDWVTLSLMVPALAFSLLNRKHIALQVIWAGILGYLIYNYAFYLLGAVFNADFLVYVGIIATSVWALVALLRNVPVQQISASTKKHRWIAGYLFFIAVMLVAIEIPPSIGFLFNGTLPEIVIKSNHPTNVVYALDLTMVVPTLLVAGYWLWKRKGWGIVLSGIMLVKAAAYGLVLCSGSILLLLGKIDHDPLLPFYFFLAAGGITGLAVLLKKIDFQQKDAGTSADVLAGKGRRISHK
jgi:hypothetical protein